MADKVEIEARLRGARKAEREARGVARGVDSIGAASRRAGRGIGFLKSHTATARGSLSDLGGAARRGALGLGALAGAAGLYGAKAGLTFNATMEQNQVAFTQFLGGAKAARTELKTLYNIAKTTPFEFADVTLATRKMLAMGFGVKDANKQLRIIADTASGLALDQGGIDRMVLVLGQIKSKDKLFTEDLRQLQELGAVDVKTLAKDLGVSKKEMAEIGSEGISGKKALEALNKQWRRNFGGMSVKQAKTFNGQLSNMKDSLNETLGTITKPGFLALRDKVFPGLNDAIEETAKIWKRDDLDMDEKFRRMGDAFSRELGPFGRKIAGELGEMNLDQKLLDGFEDVAPKMADKAAQIAPKVVGSFVDAWLNAGPWGKLISGAWVAKKLGIGKGVLAALSGLGGGRGGRGGLGGVLGSAKPIPVFVVNPGGVGGPMPGGKGGSKIPPWLGKWGPRALKGGGLASVGFGMWELAKATHKNNFPSGSGVGADRHRREETNRPSRDNRHAFERVREPVAKRDLFQHNYATRGLRRGGEDRPNVFQVNLDGRVIAEVVDKHVKKDANRR